MCPGVGFRRFSTAGNVQDDEEVWFLPTHDRKFAQLDSARGRVHPPHGTIRCICRIEDRKRVESRMVWGK